MTTPPRQYHPGRRSLLWLGGLAWTGLLAGVVFLNEHDHGKIRESIGLVEARTHFQKDLYYRFWNLPENPSVRPDSAKLVHDLSKHQFGLHSHLAVRKAASPVNDPDEWENSALAELETGKAEVSQILKEGGVPVLRYMGPVLATQECVSCHANFKPGYLRGGLSVTVPLNAAWVESIEAEQAKNTIIMSSVWLLGIGGLLLLGMNQRQEEKALQALLTDMERKEQRQRLMIDHAPVAYQALDDQGRILSVNEAWSALTGRTMATAVGSSFNSLLHEEDQAAQAACMARLVQVGFVNNEELRLVRHDGAVAMLAISARCEKDAAGNTVQIHCVLRDITEQKRIQNALEQSEARYRLIADHTSDIIFIYDNQSERFEYVSTSALRILGVRPEDAVGKPLKAFLAEDTQAWVAEAHPRRIAAILAGDESAMNQTYELNIRRPDGGVIPMEAQTSLVCNELGVPVRMIGVVRDISKRRQSENALADTARRFQSIIENGHAGYFRLGSDKTYVAVNAAWLSMHGYQAAEEVLGKPYDSTQMEADKDAADGIIERLLNGQSIPPGEFSRRRKDGAVAFHTYSLGAVTEESRIVGVEGFLIDTTQLRKARADSAMLFNEMIDAFALHEIICDATGRPSDFRYLAVNPAFERITGMKAEQVIGHSAMQVFPRMGRTWIERFGRVALTGESMTFEDYSEAFSRHLSVSAFQPEPGRFACVFLDVTDRKRAEAKLEYDEAELAAIHEHVPMVLILLDSERKVRRFNRAASVFAEQNGIGSGSPESPGIFLGCFNAISSGIACGHGPDCAHCPLRNAISETLENGASHISEESKLLVVHGESPTELIIRFSTAQVLVGAEPMALLCIEDVTQLKEAEQHMRRQAELLDITSDAICVLSPSYTIEYWNRAAQRIFGWTDKEAVGCDWETLIFKKESQAFRDGFDKALASGEWSGELRALAKDGAPLWLQARASLISADPRHPNSVLLVCTNITESKRMEQQWLRAQRLDNLGSLASGIAHDLNNVLSPILMSADLLPPIITSKDHQPLVQMLRDSAKRGAEIVQQLLIFSRGSDTPRIPLEPARLIKEMTLFVNQTFPRNIRLSSSAPDKLWQIMGDNTQLHQVLLNLCVNARDAMPEGGALGMSASNSELDEGAARIHPDAKAGPYVVFKVTDSGEGIAPDIMDKIFDPFFTTKTAGKGTGLGLSTVLAIAKSHGGFVSVSSQVGVGTEFKVHIPAAIKPITPPSQPEVEIDLRGNGETILVIDDEANIKDLMRLALTSHNYKVRLASDGAQGLAVFAENPAAIQAVFTDMMMPHLDGRLCIQCIRQIDTHVPIIAMSGMHEQEKVLEKLDHPDIRFILKPFTIRAMLSLLREALGSAK